MKKKTTDVQTINDKTLAQSLASIEEVLQQEAKEAAAIDADIKALQAKLKKMNMQLLSDVEVQATAGRTLLYKQENNLFFVSDDNSHYSLLIDAAQIIKKEMHAKYLPELLNKIREEYLLQKELEREIA